MVEDPITGDITDMFSFRYINLEDEEPPMIFGKIIAIVNTMTPAKQRIADLVLCVKQEQVSTIFTYQHGLKRAVFEETFLMSSYIPSGHLPCYDSPLYFYNYNYPEVDEDNFVVFNYML